MPVIGRLDEQVNEVLITPLEQRREPRPAAGETEPSPEPTDDTHISETSPPPDELPVWLL